MKRDKHAEVYKPTVQYPYVELFIEKYTYMNLQQSYRFVDKYKSLKMNYTYRRKEPNINPKSF